MRTKAHTVKGVDGNEYPGEGCSESPGLVRPDAARPGNILPEPPTERRGCTAGAAVLPVDLAGLVSRYPRRGYHVVP